MASSNVTAAEHKKGIVALFVVTLTWALFSVLARAMHAELGNINQLTLRLVLAAFFLCLLKPDLLNVQGYKKYTRADWRLLFWRSLLFTALGSLPWIAAINSTDIATTSFVQALPFTCLWGVLIFRERRPPVVWAILAFAIAGAAVMFGILPGQVVRLGRGESLAIVSSMAFPLALILRRKHSSGPQDMDLSALVLIFGALQAFLAGFLLKEAWPEHLSLWMLGLGTIGGILVAASLVFASYGMPRVSGVLSGVIFTLESPLCTVLAFVCFHEVPSQRTLIGGGMILLAAVTMSLVEHRITVRKDSGNVALA